jgi:hypothetical protein
LRTEHHSGGDRECETRSCTEGENASSAVASCTSGSNSFMLSSLSHTTRGARWNAIGRTYRLHPGMPDRVQRKLAIDTKV